MRRESYAANELRHGQARIEPATRGSFRRLWTGKHARQISANSERCVAAGDRRTAGRGFRRGVRREALGIACGRWFAGLGSRNVDRAPGEFPTCGRTSGCGAVHGNPRSQRSQSPGHGTPRGRELGARRGQRKRSHPRCRARRAPTSRAHRTRYARRNLRWTRSLGRAAGAFGHEAPLLCRLFEPD